jgi:fructose/tagatose bisphosphate aldolase
MALVSLRQLLDHAAEHGYGVPAFNINNMEQVQAIMQAADETDSPAILQTSAGPGRACGWRVDSTLELLDRHTLGKVARLINVGALEYRHMIGE